MSFFLHILLYTLNVIFLENGTFLCPLAWVQKFKVYLHFLPSHNSQINSKFSQLCLQNILNSSTHLHLPFRQPSCLTWTAAIAHLVSLLPLISMQCHLHPVKSQSHVIYKKRTLPETSRSGTKASIRQTLTCSFSKRNP